MNRENFFRKYDKIVAGFGDTKPSILLHSCCGPCSSSVIELLSQHFDVTVLWYNPNLWPEEEFEKRLATQKQLISCLAEDGICAGLLTLPWRSEEVVNMDQVAEGDEVKVSWDMEDLRTSLRRAKDASSALRYASKRLPGSRPSVALTGSAQRSPCPRARMRSS